MNLDLIIFQEIHQFSGKSKILDLIAIFLAKYVGYFLILIALFLFRNFKKHWSILLQIFSAAILARLIIVEIIRYLFARVRPFVFLNFQPLFQYDPNKFSFPSGHAAFYFALSTIIYFYNKKAGLFFYLASFLISISRVFSGVHWPSDILAGAIVGIFSGWLTIRFSRKFFLNNEKQLPQ